MARPPHYALAAAGWDADLSLRAAQRFDALRPLAGALPSVRHAWTEVLITRFEAAHAAWKLREAPGDLALLREAHARHRSAMERLARECEARGTRET